MKQRDELPERTECLLAAVTSKEVDIIYGRGTGRLHAPSMARIGCREHRVRSSLFSNHFLREYQHSPTNSCQKAFCPFREFCFPKTCSNPVAAAVYKNKLTVSRRRYLARVLSSLMYRYVCARAKAMSAFLIYCHGYGDFRPITSLTFKLFRQCFPLLIQFLQLLPACSLFFG